MQYSYQQMKCCQNANYSAKNFIIRYSLSASRELRGGAHEYDCIVVITEFVTSRKCISIYIVCIILEWKIAVILLK